MPKRLFAVCRLLSCASVVSLMVGCASAGTRAPSASAKQASGPVRLAAPAKALRRAAAPAPQPPQDGESHAGAPDPAEVGDAEPALDALRPGSGNRPYRVGGRSFVPQTEDLAHVERGLASWYGRRFHGRRTASGEAYDMHAMTAAHPTLPLPSYVRVRNPSNGREVIVRVNDRGPFHPGRIIDLSHMAARKLGVSGGLATVELRRITGEEIRTGAWRRDGQPDAGDRRLALRQIEAAGVALAAAEQAVALNGLSSVAAAPSVPNPPNPPNPDSSAVTPVAFAALSAGPALSTAAAVTVAERLPERAPTRLPALALPAGLNGFWVQLGAFRLRDGAETFQRQVVADLGWIAPALSVLSETELHRLQAGPYASLDQAHGIAVRLREALSLVPVIVERR